MLNTSPFYAPSSDLLRGRPPPRSSSSVKPFYFRGFRLERRPTKAPTEVAAAHPARHEMDVQHLVAPSRDAAFASTAILVGILFGGCSSASPAPGGPAVDAPSPPPAVAPSPLPSPALPSPPPTAAAARPDRVPPWVDISSMETIRCMSRGPTKTEPKNCDLLLAFEPALMDAIETCPAPPRSGPELPRITFILRVDFRKRQLRVSLGKRSTVDVTTSQPIVACVNGKVGMVREWHAFDHREDRYIFLMRAIYHDR